MKTKVGTARRDAAQAIDAKQAEAQTAWDGLQTVKSGFLAKGADALADEAAFSEVDEAGKAYDTVRDELEGLKARYGRIAEMVGEDEPAGAGLFGAAAGLASCAAPAPGASASASPRATSTPPSRPAASSTWPKAPIGDRCGQGLRACRREDHCYERPTPRPATCSPPTASASCA